ncbi:MAG: hypothetical protein ABI867_28250 [Kofleriaceae bacterium]
MTCASPRRLLEDLARIGAALAKHDRVRPEVELHLASGQSVRGRIVSLADGAMAIVQVAGTTVAFVRVDQIAAVTVADASVLVKPAVADAPVPSKLELQRQAAARADGLATAFGRPVTLQLAGASELDDDGRRAIGVVLPVVAEVMTAIATDELGREAVKALDVIELGSASTGEVRLDGKRLVIRAPKLLSEQYTHTTLRTAIEKLL